MSDPGRPSTSSPTPVASSSTRQAFKRSYQACLHCRKRKIKCIPKQDSSEQNPACVRCSRERRQCIFSAERRVQTRAQTQPSNGPQRRTLAVNAALGSDQQRTHGNNTHASLTRENIGLNELPQQHAGQRTNDRVDLTDRIVNTLVTNHKDALDLLSKADDRRDSPQNHPSDSHQSMITEHLEAKDGSSVTAFASEYVAEGWCCLRHQLSNATRGVLEVWKSCPFVAQGWMTAQEAVSYVDLFFRNMSPMSAVVDGFFRDHSNHHILIKEEPVLCSTILALSSRYHLLAGEGGVCRGFILHDRLWKHCQASFHKVIWGQERKPKGNTRALGTIESLLLVTEWHPRSLHLTFDVSDYEADGELFRDDESAEMAQVPSDWLEGVVVPVRRSNRMSWMLLGSALALAHERNLFTENDHVSSIETPSYSNLLLRERCERLKRVLFIYINQLTSLIGCSTPKTPFHTAMQSAINGSHWTVDTHWNDFLNSWVSLIRLVRSSSDILFPSKAATQDLLRSGRYTDLLEHFQPLLQGWLDVYNKLQDQSLHYDLLLIEYQYVRVRIYSLAIQAVASRENERSALPFTSSAEISPQDQAPLREVFDGCDSILEMILKLNGEGHLKYLPIRTYIHVASSSVYLIKLLALGVLPEERNKSLDLLENAVRALRLETVDDMHLATRFASLLKIHIQDLRRSPASFATDMNPLDPHNAPTNSASTNPPTNYYNSASAVSSNTMVGSVTNNVADRELGSAFVDDSLGYLAELDAPMQLGQFEGSTGLSLRNPLFFNMDETWNVFGNMLA